MHRLQQAGIAFRHGLFKKIIASFFPAFLVGDQERMLEIAGRRGRFAQPLFHGGPIRKSDSGGQRVLSEQTLHRLHRARGVIMSQFPLASRGVDIREHFREKGHLRMEIAERRSIES